MLLEQREGGGQAAGMAAAVCLKHGLMPREVPIDELQRELLKAGQYIPSLELRDPADLAQSATVRTSSCYELEELPPNGDLQVMGHHTLNATPFILGAINQWSLGLSACAQVVVHSLV